MQVPSRGAYRANRYTYILLGVMGTTTRSHQGIYTPRSPLFTHTACSVRFHSVVFKYCRHMTPGYMLVQIRIYTCVCCSSCTAHKNQHHNILAVRGMAGTIPCSARTDEQTVHRSSIPPTISESESGSAVARRAGSAVACEAVGVEDAPGVPARSTARVDRLRQEKNTMRLRRRL